LQAGIFEEGVEKSVRQEKEQVAMRLLKKNMSLDDSVELIGLSIE
jgi:hypothetical protein